MDATDPVEPLPTSWVFDLSGIAEGEDLVAVGGDLRAGTLLEAYRSGLFPMGLGEHGRRPMGWWSPDPRGVLLPGGVHVSRSLRRSLRRFELRVDTAFDEVVQACADPARQGRWITPEIMDAYGELHALGWAHSIETWQDGQLVGGLYGVVVGGLFAGESMFHRVTDASKAAVVAMAGYVFADGNPRRLVDVQWATDHLRTLGVVSIPRSDYLRRLAAAVALPPPTFRPCP
ncbi:leucyl/phenylalanyl-tRNA--protein transferase [Pedococcus sp. 5OH_020]|uniref:leucyl/phenylalanyl-tRNA--protein transferase n=1 Tax=Pedococcus sp. 5OH_020 TaxID=2989814 RepID=UPI0022E9DD06|nr:leucyl/phenylalanyl-tRNA--protein transferase [Pedococcus sp. 5OH_020]